MTRTQNYCFAIFVILVAICAARFVPDWKDGNGLLFGVMTADTMQNIITLCYAIPLGIAALVSNRASQVALVIIGVLALANGLGFWLLGELPTRYLVIAINPELTMLNGLSFDALLFIILGLSMLWLSPLRKQLFGRA